MAGRSQGGSEQRSPYSPQFITALNEFEDRTSAALGLEAASSDSKPDASGGGGKGGGAGSAAAGAGGWLLNRCDGMVVVDACFECCGFVLYRRPLFYAVLSCDGDGVVVRVVSAWSVPDTAAGGMVVNTWRRKSRFRFWDRACVLAACAPAFFTCFP